MVDSVDDVGAVKLRRRIKLKDATDAADWMGKGLVKSMDPLVAASDVVRKAGNYAVLGTALGAVRVAQTAAAGAGFTRGGVRVTQEKLGRR